MGMERRLERRIGWSGTAYLQRGPDEWNAVCVQNLSRRGLGLLLDLELWADLEESDLLLGRLEQGGEICLFQAKVCWSCVTDEGVQIGLEIVFFEQGSLEPMFQEACQREDSSPEFNL